MSYRLECVSLVFFGDEHEHEATKGVEVSYAASQRFSGNPTEMIRVCAISRIVQMVLSDLAFLLGSYGAQYVTSVPSSWYMVFIAMDLYIWCLS